MLSGGFEVRTKGLPTRSLTTWATPLLWFTLHLINMSTLAFIGGFYWWVPPLFLVIRFESGTAPDYTKSVHRQRLPTHFVLAFPLLEPRGTNMPLSTISGMSTVLGYTISLTLGEVWTNVPTPQGTI
ncbi:hypothetical protein VNO77_20052 [Canavalia gladiata]|uniref:Uncharacterized protein n=1 Tax=Canavalia gladiata TaxID=3824 RepID=A0AAN9LSG7_CANGL